MISLNILESSISEKMEEAISINEFL